MTILAYDEFLANKHLRYDSTGIDVDPSKLNRHLKDFQRLITAFNLRKGRAGVFAGCGLGKTLMQLVFADEIHQHHRSAMVQTLLLCPPAVQWQTAREAEKFEIGTRVKIVREQADCISGINITNYERLHLFDLSRFICVHETVVGDPKNDGLLFDIGPSNSISATMVHKEKRRHLTDRAECVAGLVNADTDGWVVWVDTDYEADAVTELIPDAIEVRGSQTIEKKEQLLRSFSDGKERVIVTKAEIGGFGLNWQHVHKTTWFAGYSYERWYQAIRRLYRFGQTMPVECHLIRTRNEESILEVLKAKEALHIEMQREMSGLMRDSMLAELGISGHNPKRYDPRNALQLPPFIRSR